MYTTIANEAQGFAWGQTILCCTDDVCISPTDSVAAHMCHIAAECTCDCACNEAAGEGSIAGCWAVSDSCGSAVAASGLLASAEPTVGAKRDCDCCCAEGSALGVGGAVMFSCTPTKNITCRHTDLC